jgi:hypothetical protein
MPITDTVVVLIILIVPPGLKEWRLTGQHRMVPGQFAEGPNSEFVRVG